MRHDGEADRLARCFEAGNYTAVAMSTRDDVWQVPAACGLIGLTGRALDGLARFDHPQARFHEAVARWIGGGDEEAERLLAGLDLPHARNLLALLRQPRIPILAMLAYGPGTCLVLREGAAADDRFATTTIGFAPGDVRNRLGAPITDYVDSDNPPAFFLTQQIEWHPLPAKLSTLPCPVIGQTSDFFIHIQSTAPWLRVFDDIIVTDHTEHAAVGPLLSGGTRVHAYPKCYGHPAALPPFAERDRPIDLLLTGTTLSHYHPDKAEVVRQLLSLDGIELAVVNGHLGTEAYYELLSRAKFTVSHYRCGGGLITRTIEASALGCVPLVQRDNVLRLFAGADPAIVDYDLGGDLADGNGLAAAVQAALTNYPALAARTADTARAVRTALNPTIVASQYLRFCTVLAARPGRRNRSEKDPIPKRTMFWKGWSPGNGTFGDLAVIRELRCGNAARWASLPDGPGPCNEIARELFLEYGSTLLKEQPDESLLADSLALWLRIPREWPNALAPRFNAIRAALHFGTPSERRQALDLARATVERGCGGWDLEPSDDVLPYDFAGSWFNYRRYLDLVTDFEGGAPFSRDRLVALILASLAHYVGRCTDDPAMVRVAVTLDPEFGSYRLELARQLGARKDAHAGDAIVLLRTLSREPLHAVEAHFHLQRMGADQQPTSGLAEALMGRVIDAEAYALRLNNPFMVAQRLSVEGSGGALVTRCRPPDPDMEISVILLDWAGTMAEEARRALRALPLDRRRRIEVIHVELFGRLMESIGADVEVTMNPDGPLPHANRGLNEGLLVASAPVVMALDSVLDPTMLTRVSGGFDDGHPRAVIDRDPVTGRARALSVGRADALRAGGFDGHHAYYGARPGLEDLLRRLILAGMAALTPDGTQTTAKLRDTLLPAVERVRSTMFPGIDDPSRTRPRAEDARLARELQNR